MIQLLQRSAKQETTRSLRSTNAPRLISASIRVDIAKRVFNVVAANTYDSLPTDIRNTTCPMANFNKKLKTHFLLLHTRNTISYPPRHQRLWITALYECAIICYVTYASRIGTVLD